MEQSKYTYLGLDLGTSGLRALLVDANGTPIASAESPCSVTNPAPGWSEQDPAQWIDACTSALAKLRADVPEAFAKIAALGVAGHMHGATLLDASGAVLRPCILWNDTRSHAQAATLDAHPECRALSGNIVFPGFTAPKLMWVADNEPNIFARTATVLLPKDYLNFWLSGKRISDMSDSAGTAWLDVGKRVWSSSLLKRSGMRPDQMPTLFEGSDVFATVAPEIATLLGLPQGVKIVAGAADNAAAACGVGALTEGDGFVSLGTSGVILAAKDGYAPLPASAVHTFCHAVANRWYQMGVILSATDCLNWLSRITGQSQADLAKRLDGPLRPPGRVTFLPYLSGERTPHNDSAIRGAFIGLDHTTDATALVQAVFEGVAFALRDNLAALRQTGTSLTSAIAIGGGARSDTWVQMIATVLNLPLHKPAAGEFGAAMGAARLAICGATGQDPALVMRKPEIAHTITPQADLVAAYDAAYRRYRAAYPAIKDL
jgi:xylulokinase